jgi:hypothetical protein
MLGPGGQNGCWAEYSSSLGREAGTPRYYGGGGGGNRTYTGAGVSAGAPGAPAVFKMYWVPMSN